MPNTSNRVRAIDLGRGIAVFLMIFVHTLWMYADTETQTNSLLGHVVHFVGKGTAGFLMCMGFSLVLSSKQSIASACKRGVVLMLAGYGMNILKFIVPISVFGTMPESFIEAYEWSSPLSTGQLVWLVQTGDILQMAGLSMFIAGLVRAYVHNKYAVLAIALFIAAISRELTGFQLDIPYLEYPFELLFGGNYHVYFPVFPWCSFILIGLFLGMLVRDANWDYNQVFDRGLYLALPGLIIGGALCLYAPEYHIGNFFHHGFGGVLWLAGINFLLLWIINKLVSGSTSNPVTRFLDYCSQRVTTMYVIQWTLICWGMGIIGFQTLNAWQTVALMPVMVALSFAVQQLLDITLARFSPKKAKPSTLASSS